jgi:nucleoside-triphosphatase
MILVVSGAVHSGKTTFLKNLVSTREALRLPFCGYLSPSVMVEGELAGYDLLDIRTRRTTPFLRTEGKADWPNVGPYFFLPAGLEAATSIIRGRKPGEILIVDEVGPMELSGRGVWPALKEALLKPPVHCLLVVRKPLLTDLRRKLGNRQVEVFDIAARDIAPSLLLRLSKMGAGSRTRRPRRSGRAGR